MTLTANEKSLIRRYLIWFYKSSKDALDRIDRKFTQVIVDRKVYGHLKAAKLALKKEEKAAFDQSVAAFKKYFEEKETEGIRAKFTSAKALTSQYAYLMARHAALEATIKDLLGKKGLAEIRRLYDEEMTRRILTREDH